MRYTRRLSDQAIVLEAIAGVRKELKARVARGAKPDSMEIGQVLIRLTSLYSVLDVERLMKIVDDADVRDGKTRRIA